jgi:uncharacterized protein (DUF1697 family)
MHTMPVVISLLRSVNVGGHNKIGMDALRELCAALRLREAQTYVQSGNVVFRTDEPDLVALSARIEKAIERKFGVRTDVILRTTFELRGAIAKNPFASRKGIEPSKLAVSFLARDPGPEARARLLALPPTPEELHLIGCELYTYFPNGMGRPAISWPRVERALAVPMTARNWNTVSRLLEMAESSEAGR